MPNDYGFSGPGDVDRVTGSNTTENSLANNAVAEHTESTVQDVLRDGFDSAENSFGGTGWTDHGYGVDRERALPTVSTYPDPD